MSEYVYVRVSEHVRAIMDQDKGRIRLKTIYIYIWGRIPQGFAPANCPKTIWAPQGCLCASDHSVTLTTMMLCCIHPL